MGSYNWDPQTFYTLDHTQKGNVASVGLHRSGGEVALYGVTFCRVC